MKRICSLFLSVFLVLSITAGIDFPSYAQSSDYWYTQLDDGTLSIWNYVGSDADVVIPSEIDGCKVTKIAYPGFCNSPSCNTIRTVQIPDTIETIDAQAFEGCIYLESIRVDAGNTNYSSQDGTLFNKDKTVLIQYPIGNERLSYQIPDGVTTVNVSAFQYSTILKEVILPESILNLSDCFSNCSALERIEVDSKNQKYSSLDGVLYNKDQTELLRCPEGKTSLSNIPESVKTIGEKAFYQNKVIQNITIPDCVTYISQQAFSQCHSLQSIVIPESVEYIASQAFMSCTSMTKLEIKEGVKEIYSSAFYNCCSLTAVVIPKSVTNLWNLAFANCSSLKSVTVLNPYCEFAVCKNLIPSNASIRGYQGSTAYHYAMTYGRNFTAVDKYSVNALGGSIRVDNPPGLRFGFSLDKTQFSGNENIEDYGFVYSFTNTDDLMVDTPGVYKKQASNRIDHGDYLTYNLVFTKIPKESYNRQISARAYVKVDGEYYYSDILVRSFSDVANAVLADSSIEQDIKNKISHLLNEGM